MNVNTSVELAQWCFSEARAWGTPRCCSFANCRVAPGLRAGLADSHSSPYVNQVQ